MEETPICASVERDLNLSVDELTRSTGTAPVDGSVAQQPSPKGTATPAPTVAP
jgi:hypothetical protein